MRTGLRIRGEKVHPEVRESSIRFAKWLRTNHSFPVRVPVYLSPRCKLKSRSGEMVFGTFFEPYDKNVEPYIRVATGDYLQDKQKLGKDNALAGILGTLAHEVVHYFQWIDDEMTAEAEVIICADDILDRYADAVDHP